MTDCSGELPRALLLLISITSHYKTYDFAARYTIINVCIMHEIMKSMRITLASWRFI